jgi:Na+/melibiose symporter-like transporter
MSTAPVPLRTKLLYAVGDTAINIKNASINRFLLFFYVDVLLVAPAAVGLVLFIGKFWDAVTDPAMGYLSDTTRSRWGRRRPYVLLSAVPMGICFYLLFAPPALSSGGLLWYLLGINLILYTAFTIFAVPYLAWGAELTRDYHERTTVVQVRALFGILGGVIGAAAPIVIANRFPDQRLGFAAMGLSLGALVAVTGLITGAAVFDRGRDRLPVASFRHFVRGLGHTFENRQFRIVFFTFCLMTVSAAMGEAVQLIVIKYWLGMYDFFPIAALVFALCFAASFPFWLTVSQRIGKTRALRLGLTLGCVAPLGWIVVQPGQRWAMVIFMIVAGAVSGCITLAISQAADVVDFDELQTGEQRAGAYFGIWAFGLKTANAIGIFLGGVLLGVVGYVPEITQSPDTLWWLVMLVGPLQSLVTLGGLLVFRRINFEADDVARIQEALAARQAAETPS